MPRRCSQAWMNGANLRSGRPSASWTTVIPAHLIGARIPVPAALPNASFTAQRLASQRGMSRIPATSSISFGLEEFLELVSSVKPDQCTLVPDAPDARTSSEGWDVAHEGERLAAIVKALRALGIRVSL